MFSRLFIIEFTCSDSQIIKWMQESKGFKNNKPIKEDAPSYMRFIPKKVLMAEKLRLREIEF
ncbi:hypothetical protein HYN56_15160 [Flavobacterium crocinum]|uniref:Uncharacterized protein n=1 Tax=Flavobacterium crocinum TaxID=2183896 RepID=A0A2S1YN34_9FLAO|nr:hypothetical protein HYN56_15160 [Flavobacterium crocinum]